MSFPNLPPADARTAFNLVWDTGLLEWVKETQPSGGSGGGAVTVADGADVAEGTTSDAAWVSGNGTVISLLKAIAAAGGSAPQVSTGTITGTNNLVMTFNAPMAAASIVIPDAGSGANVADFLFEASIDGATWAVIFGTRVSSESSGVNPLMVNDIQLNRDFGQYIFPVAGFTAIRARCYFNTGGSFPTRIVAYPTAVNDAGTVIFGGNSARTPLIVNGDGSVNAVLTNGITAIAYGNGGSLGANVIRVTVADDSTSIGAVTETAPATDTASSGLNGRLQRIAQRLTTAIANQTTELASLASIDGKLTNPLPVSAASLPLPSGAATGAKQDTGNASLASIDTKLTAPISVTGPLTDTQLRATAVPVSGTVGISGITVDPTGNLSTDSYNAYRLAERLLLTEQTTQMFAMLNDERANSQAIGYEVR